MATVSYSERRIEIEIEIEPSVFASHLSGSMRDSERVEACRRLAEQIGAEFSSAMSQLLESGVASEDFSRFEGAALDTSQLCLRAVLKAGVESLDDGASHIERHGRRYRRMDPTPRELMTSAGKIAYSRPRYRSDAGQSVVPVDELVRFAGGHFTELAAEQGMFMLSGLSPRECVSLFEKMRIEGLSLSSLHRLADTAGEQWENCKETVLAAVRAEERVPEAARTVCISLDGCMLPMRPKGEGAGKATIWKEASVATLSCYDDAGERLQTLYQGEMPEAHKATLKDQLATELAHVLDLRPDLRVTAVADAAADNWTFLSQYAPEGFQVVDYWHSCKHMGTASEEIFPHDSSARRKWYTKYRRVLRDEPEGGRDADPVPALLL